MEAKDKKLIDRSSTLFLKLILYALSLGAISLSVFLIVNTIKLDLVGEYKPILIGVSISMIPFLFIFYQSLLLLNLIDKITPKTEITNQQK